jgi:hypothetical protein
MSGSGLAASDIWGCCDEGLSDCSYALQGQRDGCGTAKPISGTSASRATGRAHGNNRQDGAIGRIFCVVARPYGRYVFGLALELRPDRLRHA